MLGFINSWFAPPSSPIGVDFGTDSIKLAQVRYVNNEPYLAAAAAADVPAHVRSDPAARAAFYVQTVRDLYAQGGFHGRDAVLALPASMMYLQHLRLPRMDEAGLKKALPWEARGKLPIDPSTAILRHLVAGEIYQDQEPRLEVIVMAARRDLVNQLLDGAARARLNVIGMSVEPTAVVNCFGHIYRRKSDPECTNCFVDIGCSGSRAIIARGQQILFARSIPIGGEHFTAATATALGISADDARLLRLRLGQLPPAGPAGATSPAAAVAAAPPAPPPVSDEFAILNAGLKSAERRQTTIVPGTVDNGTPEARQMRQVDQACRDLLNKLVEELQLCRRYYEAMTPQKPVERLIFIGGEARNRSFCQYIAQQMGLAAQVGDPLVRMARTTEVGLESGLDRRQPQPAWSVAVGLSLGPMRAGAAGAAAPAAVAAEART